MSNPLELGLQMVPCKLLHRAWGQNVGPWKAAAKSMKMVKLLRKCCSDKDILNLQRHSLILLTTFFWRIVEGGSRETAL